jgi:hypothetical protein
MCDSLIFILENVGNLCEKVIVNSIENIQKVTNDCLSTINNTDLLHMKTNKPKYNKVYTEEFNDKDIEIIWDSSDEWEEIV